MFDMFFHVKHLCFYFLITSQICLPFLFIALGYTVHLFDNLIRMIYYVDLVLIFPSSRNIVQQLLFLQFLNFCFTNTVTLKLFILDILILFYFCKFLKRKLLMITVLLNLHNIYIYIYIFEMFIFSCLFLFYIN